MSHRLHLDSADIDELFPFALVVDKQLRIVKSGPSLAQLRPHLVGRALWEQFELRTPEQLTFEQVACGDRPLCVLAERDGVLVLRGQLRYQPAADALLFVGGPALECVAQLNLQVSAFAVHEPLAELLQNGLSRFAPNEEAESIGQQLDEQRRELERTLRWLTLQYAVSDALLTNSEQDVPSRVLSLLCQSTEWQAGVMWLDDGSQLRAHSRWCNSDIEPSTNDNLSLLPYSDCGLIGEVWRGAIPKATTELPPAALRYACPIFDPHGGTLGVLEMSQPRSAPGIGTAMAISEVGIKLGMFLERERAHRELTMAKDQAEAGTRAKSEFLTNMSHELRTPLNGVLGTAQLLASCTLPPLASGYVQTLISSGNNLLSIINDLLDLAKIEAGKLDLELQDCDPCQVIEEAIEHFCGNAQTKHVLLLAEAHTARHVRCDPLRLRQVLWNLIGNALKFTSRGFVRVVMRERDGVLLFEVEDSGIGIAPGRVTQLFTPFEQAEPSVARNYGGTGLGLAICKRLITLMEGEIGVRSQPGLGSLFWFSLPLSTATSNRPTTTAPSGQSAWLLHSQQVVCSALAAGLQSVGCASVVLPSREYALQKPLVGAPPDWVFVDSALAQDAELRAWLDKTGAQVRWYAGWSGAPIGCEASTLHGALTPARVRAVMATKALPDATDAPHAAHTPRPVGRRARVLLVEDNAVNQLVASAMLKQLGYAVDVAGSGQECMRLLAMQTYAVVLMDCQMPGMDGFDTTRLIRALPQAHARGVAVIALTAGARQEDRQQCIDAGMDDFLSKPFRRAELEDMLKRWIRPEHETAQRTLVG